MLIRSRRRASDLIDCMNDLNRIPDQQDKVNLLSTDTSIFQLVPRSKFLRIPNEALVYLAKQVFGGKSQRKYIHKYCPNFARRRSTEALVAIVGHCWICVTYTWEFARWWTMSTTTRSIKRWMMKHWFQEWDLTKQAHIQTAPTTPAISEAFKRNPTKQLVGDLMLIVCHFVRQKGAANVEKIPLHAAKTREEAKNLK